MVVTQTFHRVRRFFRETGFLRGNSVPPAGFSSRGLQRADLHYLSLPEPSPARPQFVNHIHASQQKAK
jgi:hypothetical protein